MIETCYLPRLIRIGSREFRLSAPSVRESVEIIHVLNLIEDDSDIELLLDLLCKLDWSPSLQVHRTAVKGELEASHSLFFMNVYRALTQGHDPKKIANKHADSKGKIDWSTMIESYREVYGGSSWEVWNSVPFSFFLEKMKDLTRNRARQNISQASVHNPGKETIQRWKQEAKGEPTEIDLSQDEIKRSKELSKNPSKIGK